MRYFVTLGGREHTIDVERRDDGSLRVRSEAGEQAIHVLGTTAQRRVHVGASVLDVWLAPSPKELAWIGAGPVRATVQSEAERAQEHDSAQGRGASAETLHAQMPGRIVQVLIAPGQKVKAGRPLLIVEAMKMQNELCAGHDATVSEVLVQMGDAVEAGAPLVVLA